MPEGAKYSQQEALTVIAYAATSTNKSLEAAANELRWKTPEASFCSLYRYRTPLHKNREQHREILSFFRVLNSVFLPMLGIPNTLQDFAIDFHHEGYYGDKNAEGMRGIQQKNGTSWGHVYFTLDWLGSQSHTLDIVNVTRLEKDYAALVDGVVMRIRAMGLQIRAILEDRELFNLASISKFYELGVDFIMAAKIETGYRVKKEFKIRTCSRSYVVRVLFFVVQCLMHKFLNVLKRILRITARQLKARIARIAINTSKGVDFGLASL